MPSILNYIRVLLDKLTKVVHIPLLDALTPVAITNYGIRMPDIWALDGVNTSSSGSR